MPEKYTGGGGGGGRDLLRYDTVDIYPTKTWSEQY